LDATVGAGSLIAISLLGYHLLSLELFVLMCIFCTHCYFSWKQFELIPVCDVLVNPKLTTLFVGFVG